MIPLIVLAMIARPPRAWNSPDEYAFRLWLYNHAAFYEHGRMPRPGAVVLAPTYPPSPLDYELGRGDSRENSTHARMEERL